MVVVCNLGKRVAMVASEGTGHSSEASTAAAGLRPLALVEAESEVDPTRPAHGTHGAGCDAGSAFAADAGRVVRPSRFGGAQDGGFVWGLCT